VIRVNQGYKLDNLSKSGTQSKTRNTTTDEEKKGQSSEPCPAAWIIQPSTKIMAKLYLQTTVLVHGPW
jgi:hypothetical protein